MFLDAKKSNSTPMKLGDRFLAIELPDRNICIFDLIKNGAFLPEKTNDFLQFFRSIPKGKIQIAKNMQLLGELGIGNKCCFGIGPADEKSKDTVVKIFEITDPDQFKFKIKTFPLVLNQAWIGNKINFFPDQQHAIVLAEHLSVNALFVVDLVNSKSFQIPSEKDKILVQFTILDNTTILAFYEDEGFKRITIDFDKQKTMVLKCYDPDYGRETFSPYDLLALTDTVFAELSVTNKLKCREINKEGIISTFASCRAEKILPEGAFVNQETSKFTIIDPITKVLIATPHTVYCNHNDIFSCYPQTVATLTANIFDLDVFVIPDYRLKHEIEVQLSNIFSHKEPNVRALIKGYIFTEQQPENLFRLDDYFVKIPQLITTEADLKSIECYYFDKAATKISEDKTIKTACVSIENPDLLQAIDDYSKLPDINFANIHSKSDLIKAVQEQIKKINIIEIYVDHVLSEDKKKHFNKMPDVEKQRYEQIGNGLAMIKHFMNIFITEINMKRNPKIELEKALKNIEKLDINSPDFRIYRSISKLDLFLNKYDELMQLKKDLDVKATRKQKR